MEILGILLCAGTGSRMGFDKLTAPLAGKTAVERSAQALIAGGVTRLLLTAGETTREYLSTLTFSVPHQVVEGGATRQESVGRALRAGTGDIAVIHDGARAMVTPAIVRRCIESAVAYGSGIAAARATDTVLQETPEGICVVPREQVWLMQTPQCFRYDEILSAYAQAGTAATDDCTLYGMAGYTPRFVECPPDNFKLTTPADWARAERIYTRYGTGFDTHRLVEGRKLFLGGVEIPFEKGLLGHSDADVCIHAIIDALLGAAGMGDIGQLFPDSDERYRGIDSKLLLRRTVERIREKGLEIAHIDGEILAQRPKLAPYIQSMREAIASATNIDISAVSIQATTTEGMNDEGKGLCISTYAIASVR